MERGAVQRCLREVEVAFDIVSRRVDLRTLNARDVLRTNWPRMVASATPATRAAVVSVRAGSRISAESSYCLM